MLELSAYENYFYKRTPKKNRVGEFISGFSLCFTWVAKKGKFLADKWRFDKTGPHYCSVVLSKTNVFLSIYWKLKTDFIAKSTLLYMGCPLTRERK